MSAHSALPSLHELARHQARTFSRAQAHAAGVSDRVLDRLVREGVITRLARGLYCWGLPTAAFDERAWAAHLVTGVSSALGGRAALALAGATETRPTTLVAWSPVAGVRPALPALRVRTDRAGRLRHRRGTLPRIQVEDALLDVAAEEGLDEFIALTTEAIRRHRTSPTALGRVLELRRRMPYRAALGALISDLTGIESGLEFVYRRDVERAHHLPTAVRQARVVSGWRLDAWYPDYGVAIELDGRAGHLDGWRRDLRRDNAHALHAVITLRYGHIDLRSHPCAVAQQVGSALVARGWTGCLRRCRRCGAGAGAPSV